MLDQLRTQKHPQLIAGSGPMEDPNPPLMCFCNETIVLREARTPKNPGRLFLTCKTRQCKFFHWVDDPWSPSVRSRWAQAILKERERKTTGLGLCPSVDS